MSALQQQLRPHLAVGRESLAEHIRRVVDTAPPLTDAQLGRLSILLRPAPEAVARAA